ncbi:hypothetical protein [Baaleninema sp.]|uniref:hypothetical protein n=1 Tax=Baaleninema sp. TaxID=3101197 RepID=UPI003CFED543
MQDWEFLIQREGERVWRPVPSDGNAIAPGQYRIVARTPLRNALAEIRVFHRPPKTSQPGQTSPSAPQLFDSRVRQTEEDGSLLILPPTGLQPGGWDFSCAAPVTAERPEPARQVTVSLRVEGEAVTPSPTAESPTEEPSSVSPPSELPMRSSRLQLKLDREALTVKSGEPLTVSGTIIAPDGAANDTPIRGLHLRIRLREPQSLRVVSAAQRLLSGQILPLSFSYEMEIPDSCTSRLILGEVLLCDAVPNVLSKQSFTVTARLDALLEAIAGGQFDESILQRSSLAPEPYHSPKRPQPPPPPTPLDEKTAEALPPQLSTPSSKSGKGIDLPSFGNRIPSANSPWPTSDTASPDIPENPFGSFDAEPIRTPPEHPALPPDLSSTPSEPPPTPPQLSPVDRAFQALDLPNRFASRLNDFARDDDLSAWLASGVDRRHNPFDSEENASELSQWEAQEVVVEDDLELALPDFGQAELSAQTDLDAPPLPTPELDLPIGDLTVGRPLVVRVRLPESSEGVVVKLWIRDLQNQALVDGPRWLTDFFPLGDGQLESSIQLSIPRGGLDVQFEAIAVELDTERESYKATVSRRVLSSGSPTLPLTQGEG